MVEMPMTPALSNADPIGAGEASTASDAPQGAFEEMLARRLGRQLVGRFAQDNDDAAAHGGGTNEWDEPFGAPAERAQPMHAATAPIEAPAPEDEPAPVPVEGILASRGVRTAPIAGAPEPTPVKITVNRPGFPVPMAEPGTIQPGPTGDVWTHPSGLADLQLTRQQSDGAASPTLLRAAASPVVEPPTVHWSPAPARAALAASANRDLELEIVSQMGRTLNRDVERPLLELVKTSPSEAAAATATARATDTSSATDAARVPETPVTNVDVHATTDDAMGMTVAAGSAPMASGGATPETPLVNSALLNRVLDAVEMQQHLPPPRAISIEIPEMEGLRLLVTMRMDGTVHVGSSNSNQGPILEQVTPLLEAVNEALTERGFDMSADTGGRRNTPEDLEEEPQPQRSPRFRRSVRRSGFRI